MLNTAHQKVQILRWSQSQYLAVGYFTVVTTCRYSLNQAIKVQPGAEFRTN